MLCPLVKLPENYNNDADVMLIDFINKLCILGPILLKFSPGNITPSIEFIRNNILHLSVSSSIYADGFTSDNDEIVTILLDNGLSVAFFNYIEDTIENEILKKVLASLPRSRIGITLDKEEYNLDKMMSIIENNIHLCGSFIFNIDLSYGDEELFMENALGLIKNKNLNTSVYFKTDSGMSEVCARNMAQRDSNIHPIILPKILYNELLYTNPYDNDDITKENEMDYISIYTSLLKSDRVDQLYTTVVCDEFDSCLGLVYSNEESIRLAVCEKKGIYYSRSRAGIWKKGDTSGSHQTLISIKYDCDGDALKFTVLQHGNPPCFCHLNTRTCWGHSRGLKKLETMLIDRKSNSPEGSYTARLFADSGLLQKKLLEEVQELVEATEPDHIAAEAADVIYFMMTRCIAGGIGLKEIETHLDKRSFKITRRPGNAKEWRTHKAKEILGEKIQVTSAMPKNVNTLVTNNNDNNNNYNNSDSIVNFTENENKVLSVADRIKKFTK